MAESNYVVLNATVKGESLKADIYTEANFYYHDCDPKASHGTGVDVKLHYYPATRNHPDQVKAELDLVRFLGSYTSVMAVFLHKEPKLVGISSGPDQQRQAMRENGDIQEYVGNERIEALFNFEQGRPLIVKIEGLRFSDTLLIFVTY